MAHDLLSRRSLSAHLSYCAANFAAVGLIVGVLGYAGRLLGVSVPLYSSLLWATRLPDLVLILMLLPLVMAFVGALFGLVSYLPVHWLVRALEHNKTRRSSFH